MRGNTVAGMVAGLISGVVFGVMMQLMRAPAPDGPGMPMMAMVAQVVGSGSVVVGWIYHLFNSAAIGGVFGWMLGPRTADRMGLAAGIGAGYGVVWWVLGALILMPLALGMPAFAPIRMEPMFPVAMGSLMGHILFGTVLGTSFVWLRGARRSSTLGSARPA